MSFDSVHVRAKTGVNRCWDRLRGFGECGKLMGDQRIGSWHEGYDEL